jgi:putative ABC transport system permease protein
MSHYPDPPRWAHRFLGWFCHPDYAEEIEGDLYEEYMDNLEERGLSYARWTYAWTVLRSLRLYMFINRDTSLLNPNFMDMLQNYWRTANRSLRRQKLSTTLNVLGLVSGLTASLMILLHIQFELSYEKGYAHTDHIYRVVRTGAERSWAPVSLPVSEEISNFIPEVRKVARFYPVGAKVFRYVDDNAQARIFEEKAGFFADPEALDIFSLDLAAGSTASLSEPGQILISEEMAKRYFGDEEAIGKSITDLKNQAPLRVSGVFRKPDFPTHLQFDYLEPMATFLKYLPEAWQQNRNWGAAFTYLLTREDASQAYLQARTAEFAREFHKEQLASLPPEQAPDFSYRLQPLQDIHLHSHLEQEMGVNGDIRYLYIFGTVAIVILLIASFNFVNMSTAQAFSRMREVGVRKVLGAGRAQLRLQFLSEALILTFGSGILAAALLILLLPYYNELSGHQLSLLSLIQPDYLLAFIAILLIIGLFSGLYPSVFIAGFGILTALRGKSLPKSGTAFTRKALVIFQFAISMGLIISTLLVYQQMQFFQDKDMGFAKEQVVAIKLNGELKREVVQNIEVIKQTLMGNSMIEQVSAMSNLPGERFSVESLVPTGMSEEEIQDLPLLRFVRADQSFLETMNISLLEGNNFRQIDDSLAQAQFLINRKAAEALNLGNPVDREVVSYRGRQGRIIGIVEDFHFASLHSPIEPLAIELAPDWSNYLLVRANTQDLPGLLSFLQESMMKLAPGQLFSYTFLDEQLEQLYAAELRIRQVFTLFASLAVLISCLGLFGLTAYTTKARLKEVGIRKVLGARVAGIMLALSKDYLWLLLLASLIAWPGAYWLMNGWLSNFAYRISIDPGVFLLATLLVLLIAGISMAHHILKGARSNPVYVLRDE